MAGRLTPNKEEREMENKALPKRVVFFFQSTNPTIIPLNARKIDRDPDEIRNRQRASDMPRGEHAEAQAVTFWPFVKQLFQNGYKPSDLHYFVKEDGGNKKYVTVVTFNSDGSMMFLEPQTLTDLEVLFRKDAWMHFHLWENQETWCLHCLHRIPGGANCSNVGEFMIETEEAQGDGFVYEKI